MWEGPSRDREPLEMSKDTTVYSACRDRTPNCDSLYVPGDLRPAHGRWTGQKEPTDGGCGCRARREGGNLIAGR